MQVSSFADLLSGLASLPAGLVYWVIAAGAVAENLFPPLPADTFVVVAGLLASQGTVTPGLAWFVTWAANVGGALVVYGMGRRYGRLFFEQGAGRWLLNARQLTRIETFYQRWGMLAVFVARFLPGLRAIVPAFAGIGHLSFARTALSISVASAIWYGALLQAGLIAGRNFARVEAWLSGTNRVLLIIAVLMAALIARWWWRTRHAHESETEGA